MDVVYYNLPIRILETTCHLVLDNLQVYLAASIPLITNSSTLENTTKSLTGLSINSVTSPEVDNATGEIVYLDNRSPITRSADQVEQIKALIRF